MSRRAAPDSPGNERADCDAGKAPRDAGGPCGDQDREPAACHVRGQVANALTAILLHAEAIRRWSAKHGATETEIVESARQIATNAGRVWAALDDGVPATSTDGASGGDDLGMRPRFRRSCLQMAGSGARCGR